MPSNGNPAKGFCSPRSVRQEDQCGWMFGRFLGKNGNLQCFSRWMDRKIRSMNKKEVVVEAEGRRLRGCRNKVSADRWRDEERRGWISDQCSLITGAAEVQEPDVSNPVDTRGRAMGSGSRQGGRGAATHPQEIDVFPGNLGADKKKNKDHGPSAALRTDWGIGRRKFIWCCHNTAVWQHNSAASAATQVTLLFYFLFFLEIKINVKKNDFISD